MDKDAGARDNNPRGKERNGLGWVGLCPDGERWEREEEGVIQVKC